MVIRNQLRRDALHRAIVFERVAHGIVVHEGGISIGGENALQTCIKSYRKSCIRDQNSRKISLLLKH